VKFKLLTPPPSPSPIQGEGILEPFRIPSPPQTGERAGVRGKDKKGNSYTIKLKSKIKKGHKSLILLFYYYILGALCALCG
jgi:hypothetical protein